MIRRPFPSDSLLFFSPLDLGKHQKCLLCCIHLMRRISPIKHNLPQLMLTKTYCVVVDDHLGWGGVLRSVRNDGGDEVVVVVVKIEMVDTTPCDTMHHKPIHPPSNDVSAVGVDGLHLFWGRIDDWEQRVVDDDYCIIFVRGWCMDGFEGTSAGVKLRYSRSQNCDQSKDQQVNLQHPAASCTPYWRIGNRSAPPRLIWPRSAHPTTNIFVSWARQKIEKWRELLGRTPYLHHQHKVPSTTPRSGSLYHPDIRFQIPTRGRSPNTTPRSGS